MWCDYSLLSFKKLANRVESVNQRRVAATEAPHLHRAPGSVRQRGSGLIPPIQRAAAADGQAGVLKGEIRTRMRILAGP